METYHGDPGMSDAGTAGGDANPDDIADSGR
jgi:hypothetical protein